MELNYRIVFSCRQLSHKDEEKMYGHTKMNSDMNGFFGLHSTYKDNGVIDLGLSLKTQNPQVYHSSTQFGVPEGYNGTEWTDLKPELMSGQPLDHDQYGCSKAIEECDEEVEGVQSKERWGYVKVNMDGVLVGRKICILDHSHYSTLAIQLEDMFGRLCIPGLRLFQAESDFCLFYKDSNGIWRHVGDVPWKDFVDCVKRLKIVRKNRTHDLYWQ
ncbi:hypothetical protein V2J09_008720 [Rumex salicifolius]